MVLGSLLGCGRLVVGLGRDLFWILVFIGGMIFLGFFSFSRFICEVGIILRDSGGMRFKWGGVGVIFMVLIFSVFGV